jgi:hypothetical protein
MQKTGFQENQKTPYPSARVRCWLPAAVVAIVLWSCLAETRPASPQNHRLPIETIWSGSRCGCERRQPRVRWLTNPDQLAKAVAAVKSTAPGTPVFSTPMNWMRDGLVWIDMGLKPTGGYALSLAAPEAIVSAGVAVIKIRWRQPRPGGVVTQQLTSPCLLLRLAQDSFTTIQISDETGRIRAALDVSHK